MSAPGWPGGLHVCLPWHRVSETNHLVEDFSPPYLFDLGKKRAKNGKCFFSTSNSLQFETKHRITIQWGCVHVACGYLCVHLRVHLFLCVWAMTDPDPAVYRELLPCSSSPALTSLGVGNDTMVQELITWSQNHVSCPPAQPTQILHWYAFRFLVIRAELSFYKENI